MKAIAGRDYLSARNQPAKSKAEQDAHQKDDGVQLDNDRVENMRDGVQASLIANVIWTLGSFIMKYSGQLIHWILKLFHL